MSDWNRYPDIKPVFYGDYLTVQKANGICYQFVRTWAHTEWSDPKVERYGPVIAWMELPMLPEWALS